MFFTPSRGRLFVFHGHYGVGKTHAAKALVRWVNECNMKFPLDGRKLVDAWFYKWPEVIDGFKSGNWDTTDAMMHHTLTVIDDIGAEHDPSKFGLDKLCQILSHRENRWTIVTTNVPPESWAERFDRRIESRLIRNATLVDLTEAKDYSTI